MRPDIATRARLFGTSAGMYDDEGVDIAIAVIVIGSEIDMRIGGEGRVTR